MNFDIVQRQGQRADQFRFIPDADFKAIMSKIGDQVKVNILMIWNIRGHVNFMVEESDVTISINDSSFMKTENIFRGNEWFR